MAATKSPLELSVVNAFIERQERRKFKWGLETLQALIADPATVVEFMSGMGRHFELIRRSYPHAQMVQMDKSAKLLQAAAEGCGPDSVLQHAVTLPSREAAEILATLRPEVIVGHWVLCYLSKTEVQALLQDLLKSAREQGRLFLMFTEPLDASAELPGGMPHTATFENCFEVQERDYHGHIYMRRTIPALEALFPTPWAIRAYQFHPGYEDLEAEVTMPPMYTVVCEAPAAARHRDDRLSEPGEYEGGCREDGEDLAAGGGGN